MPIIRAEAAPNLVTAEQRKAVLDKLKSELSGETNDDGPVIFEIPFDSGRFDALVVWDAWSDFASEARSEAILDAYGERGAAIAQALGVTYQEAIEQQVLPYAVTPMVRRGEVDLDALKEAMVREGGFRLPNGKVDLRFPAMVLAEQAHRRLSDTLPKGYWSIVQNLGQIP